MPNQNASTNSPLAPILALALLAAWVAGQGATEVIQASVATPDVPTTTKVSAFLTLFSHGVLFDICAAVPIFFKGHRHYLQSHGALFYLFFAFLIAEVVLLYREKFFASGFHLQAFILTSSILQLVLGLWVQRLITKKTNGRHSNFQKMLHKCLALLQFIAVKVQLGLALAQVFSGKTLLVVCLIYYGIDAAAILLLTFFSRRPAETQRIQAQYEKMEYRDVLRSLELNEFNPFESFNLAKDRTVLDTESVSTESAGPDVKWYLMENRVVFLKDFEHPGGVFLLSQFAKRDLTKYLYGHLSFAYHSKSTGKVIFFNHVHGRFMKEQVRRHTFGFFSESVMQVSHKGDVTQESNIDPTNAFFSAKDFQAQKNQFYDEIEDKNHYLEFQVQFGGENSSLIFVSKSDDDSGHYTFDMSRYWLPMLGRYVMIGLDRQAPTFGWLVMSLTPNYRKIRSRIIAYLNPDYHNYEAKFGTTELGRLDQKSDADVPKKASRVFPVYVATRGRLGPSALAVSNLYGFGMSQLTKSADRYLILARNEGIVPFLDLFELAINFFLLEASGKTHADMVISRDYLYLFSNQPCFSLKWVLTDDFLGSAKTLGLWQLQCLLEAQKLRLGLDKPAIFDQVSVVATPNSLNEYSNLAQVIPKDQSLTELMGERPEAFDRVIVSGPDAWRQRIFGKEKMSDLLFNKIIFI